MAEQQKIAFFDQTPATLRTSSASTRASHFTFDHITSAAPGQASATVFSTSRRPPLNRPGTDSLALPPGAVAASSSLKSASSSTAAAPGAKGGSTARTIAGDHSGQVIVVENVDSALPSPHSPNPALSPGFLLSPASPSAEPEDSSGGSKSPRSFQSASKLIARLGRLRGGATTPQAGSQPPAAQQARRNLQQALADFAPDLQLGCNTLHFPSQSLILINDSRCLQWQHSWLTQTSIAERLRPSPVTKPSEAVELAEVPLLHSSNLVSSSAHSTNTLVAGDSLAGCGAGAWTYSAPAPTSSQLQLALFTAIEVFRQDSGPSAALPEARPNRLISVAVAAGPAASALGLHLFPARWDADGQYLIPDLPAHTAPPCASCAYICHLFACYSSEPLAAVVAEEEEAHVEQLPRSPAPSRLEQSTHHHHHNNNSTTTTTNNNNNNNNNTTNSASHPSQPAHHTGGTSHSAHHTHNNHHHHSHHHQHHHQHQPSLVSNSSSHTSRTSTTPRPHTSQSSRALGDTVASRCETSLGLYRTVNPSPSTHRATGAASIGGRPGTSQGFYHPKTGSTSTARTAISDAVAAIMSVNTSLNAAALLAGSGSSTATATGSLPTSPVLSPSGSAGQTSPGGTHNKKRSSLGHVGNNAHTAGSNRRKVSSNFRPPTIMEDADAALSANTGVRLTNHGKEPRESSVSIVGSSSTTVGNSHARRSVSDYAPGTGSGNAAGSTGPSHGLVVAPGVSISGLAVGTSAPAGTGANSAAGGAGGAAASASTASNQPPVSPQPTKSGPGGKNNATATTSSASALIASKSTRAEAESIEARTMSRTSARPATRAGTSHSGHSVTSGKSVGHGPSSTRSIGATTNGAAMATSVPSGKDASGNGNNAGGAGLGGNVASNISAGNNGASNSGASGNANKNQNAAAARDQAGRSSANANNKRSILHFSLREDISSNRGWACDPQDVFDPARQTLQEWASGRAQMARCRQVMEEAAGRAAALLGGEISDGAAATRLLEGAAKSSLAGSGPSASATASSVSVLQQYHNKATYVSLNGGSGGVRYPSGRLAIAVSSTLQGTYVWAFTDDDHARMVASFSPIGGGCCCYAGTGQLRLVCGPQGGSLVDEQATVLRSWRWGQSVSLTLQLTEHLSVRVNSRTDIQLTFRVIDPSAPLPSNAGEISAVASAGVDGEAMAQPLVSSMKLGKKQTRPHTSFKGVRINDDSGDSHLVSADSAGEEDHGDARPKTAGNDIGSQSRQNLSTRTFSINVGLKTPKVMASLAVVPLGQAVLDGLSRKAKVLLKELGRETQRRMHSAGLPATGLGDRTIITTSASSHLRSSPDIITIRPATSTFSQLLASPGIFPSQTFTPEPLSPGGMVTGERRDRNSRAMSTSTSRRTLTAAGPEAQSGSGPLGGASHGSLGSNATVNGVSVVALPPHLRAAAAAQRPGTAPAARPGSSAAVRPQTSGNLQRGTKPPPQLPGDARPTTARPPSGGQVPAIVRPTTSPASCGGVRSRKALPQYTDSDIRSWLQEGVANHMLVLGVVDASSKALAAALQEAHLRAFHGLSTDNGSRARRVVYALYDVSEASSHKLLRQRNNVVPGLLLVLGPRGQLLYLNNRVDGKEPTLRGLEKQVAACWQLADAGHALPADFQARII